jgi:hypothetical protein
MEEMKNVNNDANPPNISANTKSSKPKTIEEQLAYYKSLFQKSKKLNMYYDEEIKKYKDKLSQYEGENGKVCELIFIFKYENETFYFFKNETQKYFINSKLLAESTTNEMNSNPQNKIIDYAKDIQSKDDYLNQIILQYENKLKRILSENEQNENKIKTLRATNDSLQSQLLKAKESYENSIQNAIQMSNDILIHIKNLFDVDLSDESVRTEVYNRIDKSIENIIDVTNKESSPWQRELIVFHQKLLKNNLDTVFKIVDIELSELNQKSKWQNTIDQLILSQQEEKNKLFKTLEQNNLNIKTLNQKIAMLEQEKFNIAKQKDLTIEMLNKQINSGVNMNYLKNILISFLTTKDESIQEGLLPVIFTSLQFNESEKKVVKDARPKQGGSLLSFFSK